MAVRNICVVRPDPDRWQPKSRGQPEIPAFKKVIVGPRTWEPEGKIRWWALLVWLALLGFCLSWWAMLIGGIVTGRYIWILAAVVLLPVVTGAFVAYLKWKGGKP